jgi:uncharacterized damage-inducible protein DinB
VTEQELRAQLNGLEKSPAKIAAAVSGLSAKTLRYKPTPNKWCILEILAHLADVEIIYGYRLRQILADKNPQIGPIDQDDWTNHLGYMETSAPESVAQHALLRRSNLRLLRRIKPADLERSAFHPELNGPFRLADLLERMVKHDPNHLEQIERLKKQAK